MSDAEPREDTDGIVDANPPGAWESADTADAQSRADDADARGSVELTESGSQAPAPTPPAAAPDSAEATHVADPDLSPDGQD